MIVVPFSNHLFPCLYFFLITRFTNPNPFTFSRMDSGAFFPRAVNPSQLSSSFTLVRCKGDCEFEHQFPLPGMF